HLGDEVDHRSLVPDAARPAERVPQKPAGAARGVQRDRQERARTHGAERITGPIALLASGPVGILAIMPVSILGRYLARHRARYAAGVLLLLATNACALLIPWVTKDVVDALGNTGRSSATRETLAMGALLVVALALLQAVTRTVSRLVLLGAGQQVE